MSVKCLLPVTDRMGEIQAAGATLIDPKEVGGASMTYSHYVELDVNQVYVLTFEKIALFNA